MSHLLDRLLFFRKNVDTFSGKLGVVTREDRGWEDGYRTRWSHDKIARSTHGVNCTGSCSWDIYVKDGIVTWEMQATDYPQTRPDMPNHEPRGCPRGASASWFMYSSNRIKFPLMRRSLLELWREARSTLEPVAAWKSIVEDPEKSTRYKRARGAGGFVRVEWDEASELIAAANVHTIQEYGPDRIAGFSPIPAFSMASYAAGTRFLSLIGGTCLSFYDWYCDLPPSSPQTWGEQTDVPESAAWYDAAFLILWGSNIPQTRSPDAHFYTSVRYRGTKTVVIAPDYNEAAKFADTWVHPRPRTDAALALALVHVVLKEHFVDKQTSYFWKYCQKFTDLPVLVRLKRRGDGSDSYYVSERTLRAADFADGLGQTNNAKWKPLVVDDESGEIRVPLGSIGFRWGEEERWNLEPKDAQSGAPLTPRLSFRDAHDEAVEVGFPYFAGGGGDGAVGGDAAAATSGKSVLRRKVPARRVMCGDEEVLFATVYDLLLASYGVDAGLGGATTYDDANVPYTPAWQEAMTGVDRKVVIKLARKFAHVAALTEGRATVIIGCGVNQAYHTDMAYRAVINLLTLCGCVGKPGGGWAHYVGQEKIRPLASWATISFALDWSAPPRHMNATSYFYAHTDQFRYETVTVPELLSPTVDDADAADWNVSLIDCNVRAERMGWLPSSPQLETNPLQVAKDARDARDAASAATGKDGSGNGQTASDYVAGALKSGALRMSCEDPDNPRNFPRVLFVWRANLLGSSAKGHEYFLRHLFGARHGVSRKDLGETGGTKPQEVVWRDDAPEGKLDLCVTSDFRMSSNGMYSDIVLPAATWYEKEDLSTTDLHPFIHPFTEAVDPAWQARTDWDIFRGLAETFSKLAAEPLGTCQDIVLVPMQHDTPGELAQPDGVLDWKHEQCEPIPGKTMPRVALVERDYGKVYERFIALGPRVAKAGIGAKGIHWDATEDLAGLRELNGETSVGSDEGLCRMKTALQACETILSLAPETNGHVAERAFASLEKQTGLEHRHLASKRQEEEIRFRDLVAQPRKVISSPIWSGIESEKVSYTAFYQNVHESVPWRTLTGRQQFYQDHEWMLAFGEGFPVYKPPLDTRSLTARPLEPGELLLNFLTPHQKWSIHSTFTENLLMLTLARGGSVIWLSEDDAKRVGIADNDWIEATNDNGAVAARAIVSQRVMSGSCMMYHAQEKLVNTPGSEATKTRGIHNSVTRVIPKPTHMIGGYAHLSYSFNYYGTIGANRDETVIVKRMDRVDWMDGTRPQKFPELKARP